MVIGMGVGGIHELAAVQIQDPGIQIEKRPDDGGIVRIREHALDAGGRNDRAVAIDEVIGNLNRPKEVNGGGNHDRADEGDRHRDRQGADDGFPGHDQTLRVRTRCLRTAR